MLARLLCMDTLARLYRVLCCTLVFELQGLFAYFCFFRFCFRWLLAHGRSLACIECHKWSHPFFALCCTYASGVCVGLASWQSLGPLKSTTAVPQYVRQLQYAAIEVYGCDSSINYDLLPNIRNRVMFIHGQQVSREGVLGLKV